MILVTGASGMVGSALARALVGRAPARLAAREPSRLAPGPGQETARLDLAEPGSFPAALAGATAVFLMRPPAMARAGAMEPFVAAMRASGVGRVAFLSVKGAQRNPLLPHRGIERLVAAAGLPLTSLRANDFMQNFATVHAEAIRATGRIRLPAGRGRASLVDARDVAEAAASALLDPTPGDRAHVLTGPEALGLAQVAELLAQATGRPIAYDPPSLPRFLAERLAAGAPLAMALVMAGIYTIQRLGLAAEVTDDLPRLLGRPARRFAEFARDHRAAWTG